MTAPIPDDTQQDILDRVDAERLARRSYHTLRRAHLRGESVGLLKQGKKVMFDRRQLLAWVRGVAAPTATTK